MLDLLKIAYGSRGMLSHCESATVPFSRETEEPEKITKEESTFARHLTLLFRSLASLARRLVQRSGDEGLVRNRWWCTSLLWPSASLRTD